MDPAEYPVPTGESSFLAMSSFYWEYHRLLGFPETYDDTVTAIESTCTQEPDPECAFCSETDCFMVSYIFRFLTEGTYRVWNERLFIRSFVAQRSPL